MPEPTAVKRQNFHRFIRASPAGNEMIWRTPGISLPTNVPISPWRRKNSSDFRNFFSETSRYLPYLSMNGRPSFSASQ